MVKSEVKNRVKHFRQLCNISQAALAERSGVGQATISNIENNCHVPRVDIAIRIARALGRLVEEVFIVPLNTSP